MSWSDDYLREMSRLIPSQRDGLDERSIEALFGASSRTRSKQLAEVAVMLTHLRAVVAMPAPTPSPELAKMLKRGIVPGPTTVTSDNVGSAPDNGPQRSRLHRTAVALGLGSIITVPLMGVAAAQDRLPDAAQHVVARVIEVTTPFTVADPGSAEVRDSKPGNSDGKSRQKGKVPQVVGPEQPAADDQMPFDSDQLLDDEIIVDEEPSPDVTMPSGPVTTPDPDATGTAPRATPSPSPNPSESHPSQAPAPVPVQPASDAPTTSSASAPPTALAFPSGSPSRQDETSTGSSADLSESSDASPRPTGTATAAQADAAARRPAPAKRARRG